MCLSKAYLDTKEDGNLVAENVAQVVVRDDGIELNTLFSEPKRITGHSISEVNLEENYIILRKDGQNT